MQLTVLSICETKIKSSVLFHFFQVSFAQDSKKLVYDKANVEKSALSGFFLKCNVISSGFTVPSKQKNIIYCHTNVKFLSTIKSQ